MLRLEITESAYMEAAEQLISVVKRFRALGFTVEMDDFGSGYSSLNTLKDVPVDTLKLDMRFVSASENGGRGGSILSSVVRMAHALEIPVIAEGVEPKQQADFLKSVGCLYMQGYLFAKPMPPDAFERLIREHPLPLAAQRRFRRGVDGAADFLDATTQSTLLFNSFVGGAGIVEYAGGRVAALRLNDRFFDVLGVSRRQFGNRQYRLLEQISPDTRAAYVRMLEDAVRTGEEAGCECLFSPLGDAGEPVWLYNRVRFLSAKVDGCLFYLSVENITERKKLIDDNSELTNRLSGIINSVPGGVQRFLVTPERFQLTYCNDTTPAMLGFTNEEFRALFADDRLGTVHPNDREALRRMLDGMLAEDAPRTGEIRLRHIAKDGSWRWLRMTGSVLQREPGRVSLSTIAMDISDTVAAEEKFLAQQKELSAIVSSVPGGIFKYAAEADDQFTYVSETMLELLGYTREEFTQKFHNRFSEMVYREDRAHALQKITSDIARTGSLDSCEYRIETKSGALKWVYDVGHLIADENGRRWFIVVIVDIDERKRLEKSVSELDARAARTGLYGRLLDEVWNALIVCDRGTRELLFANAAALRLADLTREQARAMDGFDFLYRGDVPAEVSAMANAALPAACEYEREGCYYFAHLSAIDWNGRDAALLSIADRTGLWQAKRKLETVMANIPAGLAVFRLENGQVLRTYLSEGARQVLGYTEDEELQLSMSGELPRTHPEDAPRVREATARAVADRQMFNVDMRVLPKNGEPRWVNLTAKPVMEDGQLVCYGVYSDVGKRRAIEESLRISEEEYRVAAEHAGRALYRYTVSDHTIHVTEEMSRLFYDTPLTVNTPEKAVEMGGIAPESVEKWHALFAAVDRGEPGGSAELRMRMADGLYHWFDVRFTSVYAGDGAPYSAVISYADITESRERSKNRAFEREGLYQALSTIYPIVMACNLTQNRYYTIEYDAFYNHTAKQSGTFDELIAAGLSTVPEEDQAAFRGVFARENELEAFARGERMLRLEHRQYDDSGTLHWAETLVLRVDNPYDDDVLQVSVARQIGAQQANSAKLERALTLTSGELSRRLYYGELASRSAPYLLIVSYCDGRPAPYVVGNLARQLGYDDGALYPDPEKAEARILYPPDSEAIRRARADAIAIGVPSFENEYRVVRADGSLAWILRRSTRFVDQQGDAGYVTVLIDNSQQRALMERLRMEEEETRFTMAQMGKMIAHYDVKTRTLNVPPQYAQKHGIPETLADVPDCEALNARFADRRSRDAYRAFYRSLLAGEPSGKRDFKFVKADGNVCWEHLEFVSIFDADGKPERAVVAVEDATDRYEQAAETEKLRENERVMRLVAAHSERVVCSYDPRCGHARPLSQKDCALCGFPYFCKSKPEDIIASGVVLPESADALREFAREVQTGRASGEAKLHVEVERGKKRWLDVKFSTLYDKAGRAVSAVLSSLDVTDRYERDLAYARYAQSIEENSDRALVLFETDLTADLVEKQGGKAYALLQGVVGRSHTEVIGELLRAVFTDENRASAARFLSREHLLTLYADGQREAEEVWRVRFSDGRCHWAHTAIQFVADPYTAHIRAFTRISDVTAETEARLDAQRLAQRDGLTRLYNRATLESLIRDYLAGGDGEGGEPSDDESCVFLLLDLDDLKRINDRFGHAQGDRALFGIAETLRAHFRRDDLLGRIGGDEFVAFLPGVHGAAPLNATIAALVRRLATLPVGENDEHRLHCSVGCAMGRRGRDDFDTLYKQADTALYHVKRNGKNDFAFYSPEMRLADYRYEGHGTLSLRREELYDPRELRLLLLAVSAFFPVVYSANITKDTCYLMVYSDLHVSSLAETTSYERFIALASEALHPDDRAGFRSAFARDRLIAAFGEGRRSFRFPCRRLEPDGRVRPLELYCAFYQNPDGDVCHFGMLREKE